MSELFFLSMIIDHFSIVLSTISHIFVFAIQEKFNKLLNIIQRLNGEDIEDLVSPTRELMKEGTITKISARSGEKQARYLFLVSMFSA